VGAEQLPNCLVQALEVVLTQDNTDQGAGEALGHREGLLAGARSAQHIVFARR
jgi:hypothetical protein